MSEENKYRLVNLMEWNEHEQDDDVALMSLTDEYTKKMCTSDTNFYPDQNMYIGKPRYYFLILKQIQKYTYDKENVDLFCKHNPECYGEEFNIYNPNYEFGKGGEMVIKYKPIK